MMYGVKIFLIATFFSALGGLFGYFIGSMFIDIALNVVEFYGYEEKVTMLKKDLVKDSNFYIIYSPYIAATSWS